jgi:hypothetical protein
MTRARNLEGSSSAQHPAIELASAPDDQVLELITESWRRKAPKRLVRELEATQPGPNG